MVIDILPHSEAFFNSPGIFLIVRQYNAKSIKTGGLFFDFEAYGKTAIMPMPDTHQMMHVTTYGYIEGIDPWHGIENFE